MVPWSIRVQVTFSSIRILRRNEMKACVTFSLFLFVVLAPGKEETCIFPIVSIPYPEPERTEKLAKLIVWLLFLPFFQRSEMDAVVAEIHGAELFFPCNGFLPVDPVACVVQRAGSAVVIVFVVKTISFAEHSFDFFQQTALYLFDVSIWHDSIRYLSILNFRWKYAVLLKSSISSAYFTS